MIVFVTIFRFHNYHKSWLFKFGSLCVIAHLLGNAVYSAGSLYVSHFNYPGGVAMDVLHKRVNPSTDVSVHIDVATAQTGVSRFLQFHSHWRYDKSEDVTWTDEAMKLHSHIIMEFDASHLSQYKNHYKVLSHISGFDGFGFHFDTYPPIHLKLLTKLIILERSQNV
ncbi:unnamed protein product [Staurois parvus]|uniref:Mannosyltransferase n=1 Tax=Staurois parvus TaxID=386267 RepID=A0ABN9BVV8_9NEOB|nr:unnamed protein product [Staurois parvus]